MHAWRAPVPWLLASVHWRSVQGDCLAWCRLNFEINCRGPSFHCSTCAFCLGEPSSPPSLSTTPTSAPPKSAPPKAAPPNSALLNSLLPISAPSTSAPPPPFPPAVTPTLYLLHAQSNASSVPTIVVANLSNASSVPPMEGSWRTHTAVSSLPGRPNLSVSFAIESKWMVFAFVATALVGLAMMAIGYRFRDRDVTLLERVKRRIRSVTEAGKSTLFGLSGRFEWGMKPMPVDAASGFGLHDEEESNDIHVNGKKTSPTRCAARLPTARTGKRIVRPANPKHGSKLKQSSQRIGLLERERDTQDDLDEAQLEQGRSLAAAYLDPSLLKELGH